MKPKEMSSQKYTLIIGAIPGKYHVGWPAGSVIAHLISSKISGKVFWFCPFRKRGIAEIDRKSFDLENFSALEDNILSDYGYFYDGEEQKISWKFKIEKLFSGDFFLAHPKERRIYNKFFSFRRKYLKDYTENELKKCVWILLADIKRLAKPISPQNVNGIKVFNCFSVLTYGEKKSLSTTDFMHNTVFAIESNLVSDAIEFDANDLIDAYLKQFFMQKLPEKTLREKIIQQAYVFSIANRYDWKIATEKVLSDNNRIDVLFEDRLGNLTAVEIKRDTNDTSVHQLKNYIGKMRKSSKYDDKPISGIVICSKATEVLRSKAKSENFKVVEYKLLIDFSNAKNCET